MAAPMEDIILKTGQGSLYQLLCNSKKFYIRAELHERAKKTATKWVPGNIIHWPDKLITR